jgi:hypothetical protein
MRSSPPHTEAVRDDGERVDTGGWVRLLEYATGSSARVLGEPSPEFFTARNQAPRSSRMRWSTASLACPDCSKADAS